MMLTGFGSIDSMLSEDQVRRYCAEAFAGLDVHTQKILLIIPDLTRTAPIDMLFPILYAELVDKVELLDFIIAGGTHPPLTDEEINRRVGITQSERTTKYPGARFFNHIWDDPDQLRVAGTISAGEIAEISGGRMREAVAVSINKMVYDYDLLLIVGPTFPHEVVGFSGGNKYLFPGIAGQEIIDLFHWLGALITNPMIIGTKYTPVRKVIDMSAAFLPMRRMCMSLVVKDNSLAGLFIGTPEEAWEAASDLSEQIHITYKSRSFTKVLSRAPGMYADIWTGGKCMYKLEPVVADGGELIIYAPHITEVSITHGRIIREIGYHVRDYFVQQPERFSHIPGGVKAHSTHVKGIGTYIDGVEKPRINVVLATGISEEVCRSINLGYRDPATINADEWMNREDEGILYVPKAGEMLYRLKN